MTTPSIIDSDLEWERFQRTFLTVIGTAWLCRAAQVWFAPELSHPSWAILHDMIPLQLRIALWTGTGLAALACGRWGRAPLGLALAIIMPVERCISYLWSSLMFALPGDPPGHLASLAWCGWWASLATAIALVACWPLLVRRCPARR